jgi:hypothetical protein
MRRELLLLSGQGGSALSPRGSDQDDIEIGCVGANVVLASPLLYV